MLFIKNKSYGGISYKTLESHCIFVFTSLLFSKIGLISKNEKMKQLGALKFQKYPYWHVKLL